MSLSKYLPIAIASASLGALAVMAMAPRNAQAQQAQAPVQVQAPVQAQAPAAPQGEQNLDTSAPRQQPVWQTANESPKVRTTPDESLPKWVPKKGRLSVVDSSDLAENLGLVPQGTTKKNPNERISAQEKLNEERAERAKDPNNYKTSFSYSKAGRFKSRL